MKRVNKCLLLLVRSEDHIPRAYREVGEFLEFQRSRPSTLHGEEDCRLIGLWVGPLVDQLPEASGCLSVFGDRRLRIRESVGMSGMWQLCWLETDITGKSADLGPIRELIVSVLGAARSPSQHPPTPLFVPIFDTDDSPPFIRLQTERLRDMFPGLIHEPVTWNRTAGIARPFSRTDERGRPL